MTSFAAAALARAQQHSQPDRTDREGLCAAYDAAQRSGQEAAPLPEGVSCIPKGRGFALTPTANVKLVQLANATVATPDSEAYIASDTVVDLEGVR
ncbi:hypothetical protein [Haloarcula laminariae]|uniref:hypothetical protein n=1 Tax=Haloarcula laminariae TaxID=2961577 RepID=UPI0024052700|nr:hypothetical protein [Halomicroarcula sp. FL173]